MVMLIIMVIIGPFQETAAFPTLTNWPPRGKQMNEKTNKETMKRRTGIWACQISITIQSDTRNGRVIWMYPVAIGGKCCHWIKMIASMRRIELWAPVTNTRTRTLFLACPHQEGVSQQTQSSSDVEKNIYIYIYTIYWPLCNTPPRWY